MAITLFTGLPGHGKTINAIKFVDTEYKNRKVYYHGISELTLNWEKLDHPTEWYTVPDGSVILIDECQKTFPPRGPGSKVPAYVSEFETHRHRGYDVVLITQHPNLIDAHVRRLIDKHHHVVRQFGLASTTMYTGGAGVFDFKNYHERKDSTKKRVKLDKNYFNVYKSAEVHTVKPKLPAKFYFIVGIFISVAFLGLYVFTTFTGRNSESDSETAQALDSGPTESDQYYENYEYMAAHTPRVEDFAFTAPVYDSVREVKSYPWPNCISSLTMGCRCYSQQATRLDVKKDTCEAIIKKGIYDYARTNVLEPGDSVDLVALHLRAADIYTEMRLERESEAARNRRRSRDSLSTSL